MDDMISVSRYLMDLDKEHIRTLGQLLGLSYHTVSNNYEGSPTKSYLYGILAAWFRQQDDVIKTGAPSWTTLVRALDDKQLRQTGIAARIRKDKF